MIEYVKGAIERLDPASVVIGTASGVGYLLNITLSAYTAINGRKEAMLWVHESIREDAWTLYGFASLEERALFRLLIGVSGIGAGTARIILSALPPAELRQVIADGDHSRLQAVKGIGLKTAQRVIVDLRDKVKNSPDLQGSFAPAGSEGTPGAVTAPDAAVVADAVKTLVVLGYPGAAAEKVVRKLLRVDASLTVEQAVRQALSFL